MKAQELRIGNTFIEKYSNTIIHVTGLTDTGIYFTGSFEGKWQAEPIKLTEEWLLKLGFYKWVDEKDIFSNDHLSLYLMDKDFDVEAGEWYVGNDNRSNAGCYCLRKIKYVHQVQNLYFALTDRELTISSKV